MIHKRSNHSRPSKHLKFSRDIKSSSPSFTTSFDSPPKRPPVNGKPSVTPESMDAEVSDAAPRRTPHELLDETRTAMEEIAARMLFIKKEGRPKSELRELITQMALHFVAFRQLNRAILVEEDRIKAETESAKAPVDMTTLQLHNLMYEKNHYLRAIKACKDFKSKYPDIELVPEEEFFSSAPEDIKGKHLANDAAHDLMLKRLNFELFQRKELCKLHEKLEQQKASLLETIAGKKKFLSSLPSQLKSLKKASLPIQKQLGIMHTKKIKQYHAAELLPPPLYIIYTQVLAQKEAFGERIELEIVGSVKDAQAYALLQVNKENGISSNTDDKRMEDDVPDDDEDGQRRRKRPKKAQVKENADQVGIGQLHPLKVFLRVYDNDDLGTKPLRLVILKFEYMVKLNVVCVGVENSEEGSGSDILCNLFPDDTGAELPHQAAKLHCGDSLAFGENRSSRPYKWAQHLAGLDFLSEVPPLHASNEIWNGQYSKGSDISYGLSVYRRQNRVQTILKRIRSRRKAQMALVELLDSLSKLNWPSTQCENFPWVLHNPLCTLDSWSRIAIDSCLSATIVGQASNSIDLDLERRSVTSWEMESAREDGELPTALPTANIASDIVVAESIQQPELTEHSRGLTLISKNVTPFKKALTGSFRKNEDDLELILESDNEHEEPTWDDQEAANSNLAATSKSWVEYEAREFELIFCKTCQNEGILKLNAKVKISAEYPIRPPLFSLSIDGPEVCFDWFNVLRAMEAVVNVHMIDLLPLDYENYILAHQIHCLAMLFDLHFDSCNNKPKSTSVIDIGLCKPVDGALIARPIRGRDRRKMIFFGGL